MILAMLGGIALQRAVFYMHLLFCSSDVYLSENLTSKRHFTTIFGWVTSILKVCFKISDVSALPFDKAFRDTLAWWVTQIEIEICVLKGPFGFVNVVTHQG